MEGEVREERLIRQLEKSEGEWEIDRTLLAGLDHGVSELLLGRSSRQPILLVSFESGIRVTQFPKISSTPARQSAGESVTHTALSSNESYCMYVYSKLRRG